jgi:RNA polymerase sigma-70 factor, ECF subfamily
LDDTTRLALAARGGDSVALAGLVRHTRPEVWRLCARLVDAGAADDLTQDTYIRAIGALGRYRGDAPARTWLLSIARRACADAIRRRQRRRALLERLGHREHQRSPHHHAPTTTSVELETVIEDLDPDRRVAFTLTQVLGLSYAEAAELCGCPVGTIRSRVARARADLADALVTVDDSSVEPMARAVGM